MYQNPETYDEADLSDILIDADRYIPVVNHFPYLGSFISSDITDEKDVTTRITKASNLFGALRKCIFSSINVPLSLKASIYKSVTLPILLSGCECWCLTEELYRKLRNFHSPPMCSCNVPCKPQTHFPVWYFNKGTFE